MKKRKTKQQKVIDKTFEHINNLLTTAEKSITVSSVADRFWIHHCLLEMIPSVEMVLDGNGYIKTKDIVNQIKIIAEKVAPASDLECYT